jgi:hypothetical protein
MSPGCEWVVIDGFNSNEEYERLLAQIREQVLAGAAKEVRVAKPYSGVDWDEHWFQCLPGKDTWRLVAPDPPFRGIFKIVT